MADNSIYQTLIQYLSGTTLNLPASAFGSGNLQDVLTEYFPGGALTIDNVAPQQEGETVSFQNASGAAPPLVGMTLSGTFSSGADGVDLLLTATPASGWTFSHGWPLLVGSWTDDLSVSNASFTLSSIAQGPFSKGLNFSGDIGLNDAWEALLWLVGGTSTIHFAGPIGQQGTVPTFSWTAPVTGAIDFPVLGSLTVNLQLACAAISGKVQPPSALVDETAVFRRGRRMRLLTDVGPIVSTWVPQVSIGLTTSIPLASTTVPIYVDLSLPGGAVAITADTTPLSTVVLDDFASLLPEGLSLSSALPPPSTFDPGKYLTLKSLTFTLLPAARQLSSIGIDVGSTQSWTITDGISVGPIDLQFLVAPAAKQVMASLTGTVNFTGGSLALGAYYPGFTFTGGLTPGSTINLTDLMNKVLPINVDATLILDQLNFVVEPTQGNFSLTTGLTGDWAIPVGIATINLTNAWLQLTRQSSSTSGAIALQGNITPAGGGNPIQFQGSWSVPGEFSLAAQFPDIDLTKLASTLTGTTPPSGVPDIMLTKSSLAIALNPSTGSYSFSLATTALVNGSPLGSALLVVRSTSQGTGFLAGFVIPEAWSPATLFPDLNSLFNDLTFSNSGLLISTLPDSSSINLPNLQMPSLPQTVNSGFTFFTTLTLTGSIMGPLAYIFSSKVTFNLLAVVDTFQPMNSEFQAILPESQGNGAVEFTGITVTLKPGATTFSLSAGAILNIQGEHLALLGQGSITLAPPGMTFTIIIEQWNEPFGIVGLCVNEFGLQIGVKDGLVTISFVGSFDIGTGDRVFTLVVGGELVDFDAPGAILFELQSKDQQHTLMLSDIIGEFTSLDLSKVPVLREIGFKTLEFWVVDDPAGFTIGTYTFPPGIGLVADITIYQWEAKFNLQVDDKKGIIASGSINLPMTLAGVFTLSDTTGTKGPSGSINTTGFTMVQAMVPVRALLPLLPEGGQVAIPLGGGLLTEGLLSEEVLVPVLFESASPPPYLTLDGMVQFLGITESVKAEVSSKTFDFDLHFKFLDLVNATLHSHLVNPTNFSADASIDFDLNTTVGPLVIDGVTLIPQVALHGPDAHIGLGVVVNPDVIAQFTVDLTFDWSNIHFALNFTLGVKDIANEIKNLYDAVVTWLKTNVKKLFHDLLADVSKWVQAVIQIFSSIAADINNVANALANYFKTLPGDAAAYLKQIGYAFMDIVNALVNFFQMGYNDAVALVEKLWKDCSMANAFEEAVPPTTARASLRDLAFSLTGSEQGQRILLLYYAHGDEIWELLAPHPQIQSWVRELAASPGDVRRVDVLIDVGLAALTAVAPNASPELSEHIDLLLPELMRYQTLSNREVLGAVLA